MPLRIVGLVVCAVVVGTWLLPDSYVSLLNYIGLYALVTLGLVLLTGVAGIISFGQAAFVGIGAYSTAYLSTVYGASPWMGLFAGLAITVLSALVIGYVTLSLSGHYLPLGTIAWGISLYYFVGNFEGLGGHTGLTSIPAITLFGFPIDSQRRMSVLIWVIMLIAMILVANLLNSRHGRAMRSLKCGSLIAETFGANTLRLQILLFVYAAVLASISGWLYAHLLRFVNPSPFGLSMGIEYLFMAVVGGAGSIWGAVIGSAVITITKEYLTYFLPHLIGQQGNYETIIFGIVVILLLQFNRDNGITGLASKLLRPKPRPLATATSPGSSIELAAPPPRDRSTLVAINGVSKYFGGLPAISNLSFEMAKGEIVGLIGPNGAGKTTLFNLLTGVLQLSDGEIQLRGEKISGLRPRRIAALGVARTFQHVQLVPGMSVIENVMIGSYLRGHCPTWMTFFRLNHAEERDASREAKEQLRRVGCDHLADLNCDELALGQQRIVEVARAAAAKPDLILLDEPAAGLRLNEKRQLADVIRSLRAEGMTILLVEHDMDFVMTLVDRLVVVNFGRFLAQGTPEEIQNNADVLEAYLGRGAT
jgi:branched-chain amino acid transport system permease protein